MAQFDHQGLLGHEMGAVRRLHDLALEQALDGEGALVVGQVLCQEDGAEAARAQVGDVLDVSEVDERGDVVVARDLLQMLAQDLGHLPARAGASGARVEDGAHAARLRLDGRRVGLCQAQRRALAEKVAAPAACAGDERPVLL